IVTLAPSRAARSAIARPMPREPPLTNRVLPLRSIVELLPVAKASDIRNRFGQQRPELTRKGRRSTPSPRRRHRSHRVGSVPTRPSAPLLLRNEPAQHEFPRQHPPYGHSGSVVARLRKEKKTWREDDQVDRGGC